MSPPHIRRWRAADLDGCVAALAEVHQVDRYPMNWPADPHHWLCEPRPADAWVAVDDEEAIVGHVAVHRLPSSADEPPARQTAEVARLFVAPTARGSALGSALLDRVRQWARAHGTDLVLEVTSDGVAAAALYERTGWRCTGTSTAPWTAPDGSPVSLRHYTLSCDAAPAIAVRRRASRAAASRSSAGSSTSTW
ncbi:GNAT family N-acetyltransferase [Micromonospora sp. WMMD964]|uniref:GNAT family N-acetyltransferase n=1 Tax=Micromonospora sp. WMMD964 TaxID=3016091 RepID=UPI00249A6C08|nr:GNAT family N-acetyltransferase [Micromonospora sp. WMMD964]WFE99011.1 GNAT family N-acetyltransferase [Micromonospora sp. WMMD964]